MLQFFSSPPLDHNAFLESPIQRKCRQTTLATRKDEKTRREMWHTQTVDNKQAMQIDKSFIHKCNNIQPNEKKNTYIHLLSLHFVPNEIMSI